MVSTGTLDAFMSTLDEEEAAKNAKVEADHKAAAAKAQEAVTGSIPIDLTSTGSIPTTAPTPAPPPAQPSPQPVARKNPVQILPASNQVPTLSNFVMGGRTWKWLQVHKRTMFYCVAGLVLAGIAMFGALSYFEVSPNALTELTAPTTPSVTTTIRVPDPVVEPMVPLPPPPIVVPSEPGLRGRPGARVTMRARDAFPTSCATAWGVRRTDDVMYRCAPGERNGNDLCGCSVSGTVPRP